jgi:hypothetical protein
MQRNGAIASWAMALFLFCAWAVLFGLRMDVAPGDAIPAWHTYKHELTAGEPLADRLRSPMVCGQLVAAGLDESAFEQGSLRQAVRFLDSGAVESSVCARLRMSGGQSDMWVYSARLSPSARLLHWRVLLNRPACGSVIGRHNGWPVWQLTDASANLFFSFADGMLFASLGGTPDGVFDLLDQYDGLIP